MFAVKPVFQLNNIVEDFLKNPYNDGTVVLIFQENRLIFEI